MEKECKTCRYSDTDVPFIAACHHPKNKGGGCANLEWALENCCEENMKYWAPKKKVAAKKKKIPVTPKAKPEPRQDVVIRKGRIMLVDAKKGGKREKTRSSDKSVPRVPRGWSISVPGPMSRRAG